MYDREILFIDRYHFRVLAIPPNLLIHFAFKYICHFARQIISENKLMIKTLDQVRRCYNTAVTIYRLFSDKAWRFRNIRRYRRVKSSVPDDKTCDKTSRYIVSRHYTIILRGMFKFPTAI